MPSTETKELFALAKIREVIGDDGKLMQEDLVLYIKELKEKADKLDALNSRNAETSGISQSPYLSAILVDGMVNIDSEHIAYANIDDMYKNGDAVGLQLNNESIRDSVTSFCNNITDDLRTLNKLLTLQKEPKLPSNINPCSCGATFDDESTILDSFHPCNRERTKWNIHCKPQNSGCGRIVYASFEEAVITRWNNGVTDEMFEE